MHNSDFVVTAAAVLLNVLPLAMAEGDGHDMEGNHAAHNTTGQDSHLMSYFGYWKHSGLLWTYVSLTLITWIVFAPPVVILSIVRSRLAILSQLILVAMQALTLFAGIVYDMNAPDLYEGDAHRRIRWPVFLITIFWLFLGVAKSYIDRTQCFGEASEAPLPPSIAHYQQLHQEQDHSSQCLEITSASLDGCSRSSITGYEALTSLDHEADLDRGDADELAKNSFLPIRPLIATSLSRKHTNLFYTLIERTILILGFVLVVAGTVTIGGIARGKHIYNVLAHFIKGAIFFWYGLLTLGRWMGCFADFGWAWNAMPEYQSSHWKSSIPSAEFTESFVLFLYGASHVFLEHLAAWGGKWTVHDLEHVSISVMFFGGGALGMLIDSKKVRELLNTSVLYNQDHIPHSADQHAEPKSYCVSLNPMPSLVILFLGIMMSSHHQSSMLSTVIHKQWGTMFVGFSLSRAATYVLLYLPPPTSLLPTRPPSEIITSFCLTAGGVTFMISNSDTVAALESFELDTMATFAATIGLTALIMGWAVLNIALKGWAFRREHTSSFSKNYASSVA